MLRIKTLCMGLLLIGLAGCAQLIPTGTSQSPVALPTPGQSPLISPLATPTAGLFIRFHRSGGFAGTDDTWLIYEDGHVEHEGQDGSAADKVITANQLAALRSAIQTADYMALHESYVPEDTCCDRFLYEITVMLNDQTKTVRTLDAVPDEPLALSNLVTALNEVVK
jgi:hypothetical protein